MGSCWLMPALVPLRAKYWFFWELPESLEQRAESGSRAPPSYVHSPATRNGQGGNRAWTQD
jgi:hypothetical protein